MKAHVGVDSKTKLIHTILALASERVGCGDVDALLRCRICCMGETRVLGRSGLSGADGRNPRPGTAREGLHEPQVRSSVLPS